MENKDAERCIGLGSATPGRKPILTFPQGKELVTPTKRCQPTAEIVVQGNLHLPYGGEREGAEVIG